MLYCTLPNQSTISTIATTLKGYIKLMLYEYIKKVWCPNRAPSGQLDGATSGSSPWLLCSTNAFAVIVVTAAGKQKNKIIKAVVARLLCRGRQYRCLPQRSANAGVAGVVAGDTGNQSNKIINDSGAVVATDAGLQKKKNHPGGCGRPQCCTDAGDAAVVAADAGHQRKKNNPGGLPPMLY